MLITPRRRLLATAALIAPASLLPAIATLAADGAHPDAELLELGRALNAAYARERELGAQALALYRRTGRHDLEEVMDDAYEASACIVHRIEAAPPARTLEGAQGQGAGRALVPGR